MIVRNLFRKSDIGMEDLQADCQSSFVSVDRREYDGKRTYAFGEII